MITEILTNQINIALEKLGIETQTTPSLEHPADESHGDYSTNIAMVLYPKVKDQYSSPRALAEAIIGAIALSDIRVDIAGPGFINFHLTSKYFVEILSQINKHPQYGRNSAFENQKIVVEYTDPNPFKEFHIGHLYSNIVGESIARLLENSGATVWRADFFGDVGMHVAKALWGLLQKLPQDQLTISDLADKPLEERIAYFGQAYALGATKYEEDEAAKEEMRQINALVFKAAQETVLPTFNESPQINYEPFIQPSKYSYTDIKTIYATGREWSLAYFETIYARLGTKFSGYYPESRTGEYGYGMVLEGVEKGVFEKGEGGAVIFPGSKHGLHDRVFINALGLPTYEAKDLGNAVAKQKDFPHDKSVIVTGNEINEYFKVLIAALTKLYPDLGQKTHHIGHGMVRLPEGKMSSRTGKIKTGESLLNQAQNTATEILKTNGIEENDELADSIGMAAIKYALLKPNTGKDVTFNFSESVNFNGNSGPYLQYTYARCCSVLGKQDSTSTGSIKQTEIINPEEMSVLKYLSRYPEITEQAALEQAPHLICTYLHELAQRFNTFYNQHTILGSEKHPIEEETKQLRLALTAATAQVLKNGLSLLGIAAPDKM